MKKIVLTFGLISGAILSGLMLAAVPFIYKIGFESGTVVGYTSMVLAFLLVFFGIRSYRENVGEGKISFGRAFSVGILIMLIASIMYVITWEIVYQNWLNDFPEKYTNYVLEQARASGASAEEVARQSEQMNSIWTLYRSNLLVRVGFSIIEPLPVGLIMTLVSALILRRRHKEEPAEAVS